MIVDYKGFLEVDERLLCLHFDIEARPLVVVMREEFDEDMVLIKNFF